jgi:hypothetical protein
MTKQELNEYIDEHGLQDIREFSKLVIETFGKPDSIDIYHGDRQIWPPKKSSAYLTVKQEKGQPKRYMTRLTAS